MMNFVYVKVAYVKIEICVILADLALNFAMV
jgi:hypothetical protein